MNNENEILIAWTISQLITRFNELIWDQYENEFTKRYLKLEEEKYSESQSDKDYIWDTE